MVKRRAEEWALRVAKGTEGPIPQHPVLLYGEVDADPDELAALQLPPDYPLLGEVTEKNCKYECMLTRTKLRYSRRTEGSPKEQEEEAAAEGAPRIPTDEEIIREESGREIYNPDLKEINFGNQRAMDLRNNP